VIPTENKIIPTNAWALQVALAVALLSISAVLTAAGAATVDTGLAVKNISKAPRQGNRAPRGTPNDVRQRMAGVIQKVLVWRDPTVVTELLRTNGMRDQNPFDTKPG